MAVHSFWKRQYNFQKTVHYFRIFQKKEHFLRKMKIKFQMCIVFGMFPPELRSNLYKQAVTCIFHLHPAECPAGSASEKLYGDIKKMSLFFTGKIRYDESAPIVFI